MKTYKIYEFTSLLRLGLWAGGRIPELGYLSAPRQTEGDSSLAGLSGTRLGNGITLEKNRPGEGGAFTVTFSVYDPYADRYVFYELTATLTQEGDVYETMQSLLEQSGQIYTQGLTSRYISLQDRRRYHAVHSSWRSGTIATNGRRR